MNQSQADPNTLRYTDFFLPDDAQITELRSIIRAESGHKFTYDETKDVAYQLIRLYECLAEGKQILPEDYHESK